MAIQYSGTTITNTVFTSTATRLNIVTQLETALNASGWTTISGHGTGDIVVQSATTPQGMSICFELVDPGSGNCAQIKMRNLAGTKIANAAFFLPTNGQAVRIVCDAYQFFMFYSGAAAWNTFQRDTVMGGVPWVPSFIPSGLSSLEMGWILFKGVSDADTVHGATFRIAMNANSSIAVWNSASLFNNNLLNYTSNVQANPQLAIPVINQNTIFNGANNAFGRCNLWEDGSMIFIEPFIGWATGAVATNEMRLKGQLWDAGIQKVPQTQETTIAFDSHNWLCITDGVSQNALAAQGGVQGSLMVVIP